MTAADILFYVGIFLIIGGVLISISLDNPYLVLLSLVGFGLIIAAVVVRANEHSAERQDRNSELESTYDIEIHDISESDLSYIKDNVYCESAYVYYNDAYLLVENTIDCFTGAE